LGVSWELAKAVQAPTCQRKPAEKCLVHWCGESNDLTDRGK